MTIIKLRILFDVKRALDRKSFRWTRKEIILARVGSTFCRFFDHFDGIFDIVLASTEPSTEGVGFFLVCFLEGKYSGAKAFIAPLAKDFIAELFLIIQRSARS